MIHMMGARQKDLLELLLHNKSGLTIDNLAGKLNITRTAVRQHLAVLEKDRLVIKSETRPSGGRPEQLYILADAGNALFPRHYSLFAEMMLDIVEEQVGQDKVGDLLARAGEKMASKLRHEKIKGNEDLAERVDKLAVVMEDLGYSINAEKSGTANNISVIEADNCVFHDLAKTNQHVCRFDLALLATFTDSKVIHEECIVKGGGSCRFKFSEEKMIDLKLKK
jgi:predicted ArsR family transcriptional regulator